MSDINAELLAQLKREEADLTVRLEMTRRFIAGLEGKPAKATKPPRQAKPWNSSGHTLADEPE